jgi:hypothetical protein
MRGLRDAVSPNQQEVMAAKTHCDKPALSESFALAEGGGAAWFTILVDSCILTPDSSEGIDSITIQAEGLRRWDECTCRPKEKSYLCDRPKSIVVQNVQYSSTIRPVGRGGLEG